MKDQMNSKQAQAFAYVWAKRLKLKTNHTHMRTTSTRLTILHNMVKERLHLNNIEVEGLDCIIKCFDKMAYGGCGHFNNNQIKSWLMLEGANALSDFNSSIELINELVAIRAK